MDNTGKKLEPFKIPDRNQVHKDSDTKAEPPKVTATGVSDGLFYEIEYGTYPVEGVGKFVLKPQKIESQQKDEIRELFRSMRDIDTNNRFVSGQYSASFNGQAQQNTARIFYKQAMFMKDFEDDYSEQVPFSAYYPCYQMLSYGELRTYFTWRTQVRKGNVGNTSVSYAFIYVYELLNNAGVESPQDGLDKLMAFWTAYREYDATLDKYILKWLKDYHVYYNLPQAFKEFAREHDLIKHYPKIADTDDSFYLFCGISKYDIRKSAFLTDETSELITNCFHHVIGQIRQCFNSAGMDFDDELFSPKRSMIVWKPFRDGLFYPRMKQPDRKVILSENEIYVCTQNEWTFSTIITTEKGRQFIGYVMKQMESVLRKLMKYKFKLTANVSMVSPETLTVFKKLNLSIESVIETATSDFYRESTKTVVAVQHDALDRIRQEALATQQALIVEEQQPVPIPCAAVAEPDIDMVVEINSVEPPVSDEWGSLRAALSAQELQALSVILQGDSIKSFADANDIMLEVLVDGINEKAADCIGDSILDEEPILYQDYEEQVRAMVAQAIV